MNPLIRKTTEGLIFFIGALALLIFLPAGTLFYWQGWLYLFCFFCPVLLITIYLMKHDQALLERRLRVGAVAEKETSQKLIQFIAQFAFIAIFVVSALDYRFHGATVSTWITLVADMGILNGFYIIHLTFKENTYTSGIIEIDTKQKVIASGPYAVVRHPMYTGSIIMLLATPLALGSWWGILSFFPILIVIIWRLLDEERYLTKHLPGYKEYMHATRFRLLPFLF